MLVSRGRFVAHQPHTVGKKLVVIVQLRFLQHRIGRNVNLAAFDAGADRLERCLLDGFDLGEQIFKLGVRLADNAHARQIADIAVIIAAGIE